MKYREQSRVSGQLDIIMFLIQNRYISSPQQSRQTTCYEKCELQSQNVNDQFSTRAGTGSASLTAFSFFLAALGLAEVFRSFTISSSWTDLSDFTRDSSKGNPVILCGPFGISNTVNLY